MLYSEVHGLKNLEIHFYCTFFSLKIFLKHFTVRITFYFHQTPAITFTGHRLRPVNFRAIFNSFILQIWILTEWLIYLWRYTDFALSFTLGHKHKYGQKLHVCCPGNHIFFMDSWLFAIVARNIRRRSRRSRGTKWNNSLWHSETLTRTLRAHSGWCCLRKGRWRRKTFSALPYRLSNTYPRFTVLRFVGFILSKQRSCSALRRRSRRRPKFSSSKFEIWPHRDRLCFVKTENARRWDVEG